MNNTHLNKIFDSYLTVVFLFPLLTLFQAQLPSLNKILMIVLMLLQIAILFLSRLNIKYWIIILLVLLLTIFALHETNGEPYNLNTIFYFPVFILFSFTMISNKNRSIDYFFLHKKRLKFIICFWCFIVGISIFLPISYRTSWGGGIYFGSFTGTVFRLAPTGIFISVLITIYYLITKEKWVLLLFSIPMYSFFMGGSRTYWLIGISILLFSMQLIFSKNTRLILYIPAFLVLLLFTVQSSMLDKIKSTLNSSYYGGVLGGLTNGRSFFWLADISAFNELTFVNKLFGAGFNFVYDVNLRAINDLIWAHNDFIQILTTYGYLGLTLYILTIIFLFKSVKFSRKSILFIVLFIWGFNAFFNMFYTYLCSMLSLPFVFYAYEVKKLTSTTSKSVSFHKRLCLSNVLNGSLNL